VELYLFRHGPAADRDPRRWPDDDLRPLSPQGMRETRQAARGFASLVGSVDRMLASPALRAWRTAEILHDELKHPPAVERCEELVPGAPAAPILAELRRDGHGPGSVAVVGHEPTLGELLGLAVTGEAVAIARLSKAGAAALEFPRTVIPGAARIEWLLTRKQLSARWG
jgi:phosphohistidine phosphatase